MRRSEVKARIRRSRKFMINTCESESVYRIQDRKGALLPAGTFM